MIETVQVFIGVGSNLGDRKATIEGAVEVLNRHDKIEVVKVSTLIETEPVGYVDQPKFINGVIQLETTLLPEDLLEVCLAVEQQFGRVRNPKMKNGPRTLDLDILFYGETTVNTERLTIPHPRLKERDFVLEPLKELSCQRSFFSI